MKKSFKFMGIALLTFSTVLGGLGVEQHKVEAEQNPLYLEEDYNKKDPITGKYAPDFSYLDTEENMQLQKDMQNFFNSQPSDSTSSTSSTKLTSDEAEELSRRVTEFVASYDPEVKLATQSDRQISTYNYDDYFDKYDSKIIEAQLHLAKGILSPSQIAGVNTNATGAREHATRYAKNNGWYTSSGALKTWDNAADTLRHFAWNWMNANDYGTGIARAAGDIHELALIGANLLKDGAVNGDVAAAYMANNIGYRAMTSLGIFNDYFDNSSVMDLLNNSQGRKAFARGYDNYSEPFNIGLNNGSLIQFPTWINSTYRNEAWNGWK